MKSRVPLTEANLQYFAGVSRDTLNEWVDALLGSGVLDVKMESLEAEIEYTVPGGKRSVDGPTSCEEYERKRKLIDEAKRRILARRAGKPLPSEAKVDPKPVESNIPLQAQDDDERDERSTDDDDGVGVASIMGKAALLASGKALVALDKPLALLDQPRGKGEKSLPASAALSLLGPIGWLYAGSFREAIPATIAAVAVYSIVPSFLLAPFTLVGALASSAVGLTYAWQFNRKKGRTPLFLRGKTSKKSKKITD